MQGDWFNCLYAASFLNTSGLRRSAAPANPCLAKHASMAAEAAGRGAKESKRLHRRRHGVKFPKQNIGFMF
jgi:hypothetical protein